MKVLVVSGIWPPDVGGPATHAPEIADLLAQHGHRVAVLTTASAQPEERPYPVHWVSRTLPPGARHAAVAVEAARLSRLADVVYAASMVGRSAYASRSPLVVKVGGDPAFERSRRLGLYDGTLAGFQTASLGHRAAALRRWRTLTLRRAARIVCPSQFLRGLAVSWGIPAERVAVIPNAIPRVGALRPRQELRDALGVDGPMIVFAGRLTAAKALDVAFAAVERVEGATLLVAGEGEARDRLERLAGPRVRFLGALRHDDVLEMLAAADLVLLSSTWENFPHVLVEALAVGTPVVATCVGGVPEIVVDGENGLLVESGDPEALASAIYRFLDDAELRTRLAERAAPSVERFSPERVFGELEHLLATVAS